MLTKFLAKSVIACAIITAGLVVVKHKRYKALAKKEQAMYDEAFKAVDGLADRVMANVKANLEAVPQTRGYYIDREGQKQDIRSLNMFDLVMASSPTMDNQDVQDFLAVTSGKFSMGMDADGDTHPGLGGAFVKAFEPKMFYFTTDTGVKWFARFDGLSLYYGSLSSEFNEEIIRKQFGVPKEHLKKTSEGYLYTN